MREKKEINIQIGEQIKFAREQSRLTQEQLAERIDVSPQFISDLERGVVGISISTLKRLCTTLCVSGDQILFGHQNVSNSIVLMAKCNKLTEEQFQILLEIIERYIVAIESVQK